jgi:hypothetical protein
MADCRPDSIVTIACDLPRISAPFEGDKCRGFQAQRTKRTENVMAQKNAAETQRETRSSERPNLDRQYGNIGISAVAAAVRYQGESKDLSYAAPAPKSDDRS